MKSLIHSNVIGHLIVIVSLLYIFSCEFPDEPLVEEDDLEFNSGMEFVLIPAGKFTFGAGASTMKVEYDFEIMKYPVTNFHYTKFLNEQLATNKIVIEDNSVKGSYAGNEYWPAGNYEYLDLDDPECRIRYESGTFKWINKDGIKYKYHPVVEVTWFGANAYALHYGLRLPFEVEWEKAARDTTGYNYPWGDWIDHNRANFWNSGDQFDNGTTPVFYFNGNYGPPDSPSSYGVYDMAGNVWEWMVQGEHHLAGYKLRGGSWTSKSSFTSQGGEYNLDITIWLSRKGSFSPITSTGDIGFRCIREFAVDH
ncbi:MAG: SUMF1/EgtB/PvdO family nonheme iron enzyme [Candidatus Neomarinimicrobiota bacterium]